jgi:alanine racemase
LKSLSALEISASALKHNVRALKALSPSTPVAAVVKGNAYGHGLTETVTAIEPEVDAFQVDDIEELRALRRLTSKRALVLGYVALGDLEEAIALGGELTLYDTERFDVLNRLGATVHLKIDALLGRLGVPLDNVQDFISSLANYPNIQISSAYAHYANIEDTSDNTHALRQRERLNEALQVCRNYYPQLGSHLSATSGLMALGSSGDLLRLGIGCYGLYPSDSLRESHADLQLRPALRWISHLAQVKVLPAGHPVGYGLTYTAPHEMKIAIVPQGYSDGYDRGLSNSGIVLVKGVRCPVIGRVAMNMFAIDVSELADVRQEDEVVLLGQQGSDRISAEEIAARIDTINYEVVARLSPLTPRVLVDA